MPPRSGNSKRSNENMKLFMTTIFGIVFGFFLGAYFPATSISKMNLPSNLLPNFDLAYIEDNYSGLSTQALLNIWSSLKRNKGPKEHDLKKIWVPTNPRGAERLPPGIIEVESDLNLRRLWGLPSEDVVIKPRYLVTFTVGLAQIKNINAAVKKFSENFTILLFHYDGRTSEWDQFDWSQRAIHISVRRQTKWWYAKRFLHPDIVAQFDYIFIWDEDLGLEHFDGEEYLKMVRKHGLEISQPGLEPSSGFTWQMTRKRDDSEVHKEKTKKLEKLILGLRPLLVLQQGKKRTGRSSSSPTSLACVGGRFIASSQLRDPLDLCEFIEDCEFTYLSTQILHFLGIEGPKTSDPSKYIRYIYNRVILENATVRASAVSTLAKFGAMVDSLKPRVFVLLRRCLFDSDGEESTLYLR